MSESKGLAGKGMLGCGALLLLACSASCLFWGFHVFLDPHGRISDDEALPGMLASMLCGFVSIVLAAIGGFLAMQKSKGDAAPVAPGAAPGAPGAAPSAPAGKKPFPTHLVAGCASLLMLVMSCVAFAGAGYFYDRVQSAERFEQFAYDDERRYGVNYGLGPDYWRRQAEERQQFLLGSLCCGGFFLLLFVGLVVGAALMFRRNQAAASAPLADGPTLPDAGPGPGGFTPPPPGG